MKNWNNLKKEVIDKELCTYCGTCIGVCPKDVIRFNNDKIIKNNNNCISCGLCFENCPGIEYDFEYYNQAVFNKSHKNVNRDIGYYKRIYRGYSNNQNIREKGASGGIVTNILISLLNKGLIDGAAVISNKDDSNNEFNVKVATTVDEIIDAAQSKYCIVPTNEVVKELKRLDGKYAYVGLPCQIQGMRKLEKNDSDLSSRIYIYIGLFCGFNLYNEGTNFLLDKMNINKNDIKKIEYRARKNDVSGFKVIKKNDEDVFIDKHSYSYLNILFSPKRCWKCYDLTSEFADISVGDAWEKKEHGWSRIIVRSPKGQELIKTLQSSGSLYLENSSIDDIYKTQSQLIDYKKKGFWVRKKLINDFPDYNICNLEKLSFKDKSIGLIFYIILKLGKISLIRKFIYILPMNIVSGLSKFARAYLKGDKI